MPRLPSYHTYHRYHPYPRPRRRCYCEHMEVKDHEWCCYDEDRGEDFPPPAFLHAVSIGGADPDGDVPMLDLNAPSAGIERPEDGMKNRRRGLFMVLDIMKTMRRNSLVLLALEMLGL